MTYLPVKCFDGNEWLIKNEYLGSGHEGDVYPACCNNDCHFIAKKIFTKYLPPHEIEIQKIASYFNIAPKIYDIIEDDTNTYIIMAKLDNTLAQEIEEFQDEPKIVYQLFLNAIEKINKLHELGISHNDITLTNIMVNQENQVFLIDYGTSTLNDEGFYTDFLGLFYELTMGYPKLAKYIKKKLSKDDIFEPYILNDLIPEEE